MQVSVLQLQELEPDNPRIQAQVGNLKLLEAFSGLSRMATQSRENYQAKRWKQWGKLMMASPKFEVTTSQFIATFTVNEMNTILRSWKLPGSNQNQVQKEQLAALVVEQLKAENVSENLDSVLSEQDRSALAFLLNLGSQASYQEWREQASFDDSLSEVDLRSTYNLAGKLPGSLMGLGLVYIGSVESYNEEIAPSRKNPRVKNPAQLMAYIPVDLRFALREALGLFKAV